MTRSASVREPSPLGDPMVTAADVAEFMHVDTSTIYRLAASGALPSIEIAPRIVRFRLADVREYVQRHTRQSPARGRVKQLLGGEHA